MNIRVATDPPVSERQRRAMEAAAHGHSTLGIPQSVGEEFVGKDMSPENWDALMVNLFKWLMEEREEPEHIEGDAGFNEGDHPRGQPENAGQFGPGGGGGSEKSAPSNIDPTSSAVRLDSHGMGVQEQGGYAGVSDEYWDLWVNHSDAINDALGGGLKVGDTIGSGFVVENEVELKKLTEVANKIQNAAKSNAIQGQSLGRAETFATVEELEAKWPVGKTVSLDRLTAAAATNNFKKVFDLYAPKEGNESRIRAMVYFGDKPQMGVQAAHGGATGASRAEPGKPVKSDEVILPKGAKYRVESVYQHRFEPGVYTIVLKPSSRLPKETPVAKLSKYYTTDGALDAQDSALALDKATARRLDPATGHMHVESTPISKANVCGYLGSEINEVMRDKPGWRPLADDVMYQMLRDPDELAKAADSFNGKPLLLVHKPLSATDHPKELVIGSTGTKAVFEDPYLKNDLSVWEQDGIDGIESDAKKELSSAYSYRADMTPGTFRGAKYDGVMRDIRGNHVAVVKEGRAGPDVVVGDAAIPKLEELFNMTKTVLTRKAAMVQGAVAVFLAPRLAQDAKVDLTEALKGTHSKNYKAGVSKLALDISNLCKGKLKPEIKIAADGVEGLKTMLDALEPMEPMEGPDTDASSGLPMSAEEMQKKTMDNDPWMKIEALLKGKVDDATLMAIKTMMAPPASGMDAETEEERKKKEAEDKMARDKELEAGKADHVSKPAMDAAVKAAAEATEKRVLASQKALREAERFVKPWVGELAVACDSAEAVHREALKIMGVTIEADLDPRALPSIIRAQPVPGAKPAQQSTHVAQDSAAASDYNKEFPGAERIRVIG